MSDEGSRWRKWDLHVHTPASLVHHYSRLDVWEKFVKALEDLPPEFKVIGINDYIFLDGYRRIKEEQAKGRLSNIELFLPVVELRLDKFGGTKTSVSRVNYHVIFSDSVLVEIIESQFLAALRSEYILTPEQTELAKSGQWTGVPTRESLVGATRAFRHPQTLRACGTHCAVPLGMNALDRLRPREQFETVPLEPLGGERWKITDVDAPFACMLRWGFKMLGLIAPIHLLLATVALVAWGIIFLFLGVAFGAASGVR